MFGIGEASPMHPDVTKVTVETQLKPLLVGMDARDIEACWEKLYVSTYKTRGQGTSIAISGVDIALHDLAGKALGGAGVPPARRPVPGEGARLRQLHEPRSVR